MFRRIRMAADWSQQTLAEVAGIEQSHPALTWDIIESSYSTWRRLGEPGVDQFGVIAPDDTALRYVWFNHRDSQHRWPLPL